MQYDLNQIGDPTKFQRLLNAILTARFGEDARLTPLRGPDGGSDGETAPGNPYMEFQYAANPSSQGQSLLTPPRRGRYLFQAKYHQTGEHRLSDLRTRVVQDFARELDTAVLGRADRRDVNYFFLVTNVPASKNALAQIDEVRRRLLRKRKHLHADVWWGERITAFLDWYPDIWPAFPDVFRGGIPSLLAQTFTRDSHGLSRPIRVAVSHQHARDLTVKFRQVRLEHKLSDLFVDLDVDLWLDADYLSAHPPRGLVPPRTNPSTAMVPPFGLMRPLESPTAALELLINDEVGLPRILLEGGPGQGKSTITQMAAQVYRERLLRDPDVRPRDPTWEIISKARFPIRLELRHFAEWLFDRPGGTLEQYVAGAISQDSGGATVTVEHLQDLVAAGSVILLLDGLDEIGSDKLRDRVLDTVLETIERLENGLKVDLRVVLTTRPPALTGRRDKLDGFSRAVLTSMTTERVDNYVERWLVAQIEPEDERDRILEAFRARRNDPHMDALTRNPMQLSVLLQFIKLKADAFPERRAELYRDYFQIVIDRDVEKSGELRKVRDLVEGLHSYLGFRLHGAAEIDGGRRTLRRDELVTLTEDWLRRESQVERVPEEFFALGEERFGLIVAMSGEGEDTNYGFEVQPIQEYFAASHISTGLPNGMAHEVFELLIHRNHWREVALFLAGLRRRNEKADLIARARAADEETSKAWRQNGRAIILQLLREGVFRQPRHVLTEAMSLAMDLLDMKKLRVQRTPAALVTTLQEVGQLYPTRAFRDRVVEVAEDLFGSADEDAVSVIYGLAAKLLPMEEYRDLVGRFEGGSAGVRSVVRMRCTYGRPAALEALAGAPQYWAGVPPARWAQEFWEVGRQQGYVVDVDYPAGLHESVVTEFAVDYRLGRLWEPGVIELRGAGSRAIWTLLRNVQIMGRGLEEGSQGVGVGGRRGGASTNEGEGVPSAGDVDCRGLSRQMAGCLRELIETSNEVNEILVGGGKGIDRALERYVGVIGEHMGDPGVPAWVAGRCLVRLLLAGPSLWRRTGVGRAVEALGGLCGRDVRFTGYGYYGEGLRIGTPMKVRLALGEELVPVWRVMAKAVEGRLGKVERDACLWIADIPVSRGGVRALVDACGESLAELLRFLGERRVFAYGRESPLRVQDTQRVLKLCRGTEEVGVLGGAATVLMNASFARIAEPELVAKILAAAPGSQLVGRVFGREGQERRRTAVGHGAARELGRLVAERVLAEPEMYATGVVSRAAGFMRETEEFRATPLFEEREDLVQMHG